MEQTAIGSFLHDHSRNESRQPGSCLLHRRIDAHKTAALLWFHTGSDQRHSRNKSAPENNKENSSNHKYQGMLDARQVGNYQNWNYREQGSNNVNSFFAVFIGQAARHLRSYNSSQSAKQVNVA